MIVLLPLPQVLLPMIHPVLDFLHILQYLLFLLCLLFLLLLLLLFFQLLLLLLMSSFLSFFFLLQLPLLFFHFLMKLLIFLDDLHRIRWTCCPRLRIRRQIVSSSRIVIVFDVLNRLIDIFQLPLKVVPLPLSHPQLLLLHLHIINFLRT